MTEVKKKCVQTNNDCLFQLLLDPKDYSFACTIPKYKVYSSRDNIRFFNETEHDIFMIISGRVKLGFYNSSGKQIITEILYKEDIFGETFLFNPKEVKRFAIALDNNTKIGSRPLKEVQMMMSQNKHLSSLIYDKVRINLRNLELRIIAYTGATVLSKVIHFLNSMAEKHGSQSGSQIIVNGRYTHKDIARYIGTSRQCVTEKLSLLKKIGVIDYDFEKITIVDENALNELSHIEDIMNQ